jgi:predicted lactoylglutathione lyase
VADARSRKLFVNLAVRDLERSKAFFAGLGFTFNPKFTNDAGACMVVGADSFVMLLTEPFFKGFTKREPCDTTRFSEGLFAIDCASRAEVDAFVDRALATGGSPAMDPSDMGFMYMRTFYDLDGHHWEVFWMDATAQ